MRVLITLWTVGKRITRVRNGVYLLKGHGSINSNKTGDATDPECNHRGKFLATSSGTLAELLEGRIGGKPYSRVSALPHHLKSELE